MVLSPTRATMTGLASRTRNIRVGLPTTLVHYGSQRRARQLAINDSTLAYYGTTIKLYDHNKDVKIEGGKLFIDGKEVTEYTFKQNYYFMMGDNRHNSLDSRFGDLFLKITLSEKHFLSGYRLIEMQTSPQNQVEQVL